MTRLSLRHYSRVYTAPLFAGKPLGVPLCTRLKAEPFRTVQYILRQLPLRFRLVGPACPSLHSLSRPLPTAFTDSLEHEYHWAATVLACHETELNWFLSASRDFESHLLTANYASARQTLNDITSRLGRSLWSLEALLLLEEQQFGLNANRSTMADVIDQSGGGWTRFLATLISERAETTLCPEQYDHACANLFASSPTSDGTTVQRLAAYFLYKANRPQYRDLAFLPFLLHMEEGHSVIDRLRAFAFVTVQLYVARSLHGSTELLSDLQLVTSRLPEPTMRTIALLTGYNEVPTFDAPCGLYEALDCYTRAKYKDSATFCAAILRDVPTCFEAYELLAKASARSKAALPDCFREDALGQQILSHLYAVVTRTQELSTSLYELRKLAYRLESTCLGPALFGFTSQLSNDTSPKESHAAWLLQSTVPTPRLARAAQSPALAASYLSQLESRFGGNLCIDLFEKVAREDITTLTDEASAIPLSRRLKFSAAVLEDQQRYSESLALYEELSLAERADDARDDAGTVGRVRCSINLGRVVESVSMLARVAAARPTILPREALNALFATRSPDILDELTQTIEWPVLRAMAHYHDFHSISQEDMHGILDDFLTSAEVFRPTELKDKAAQYDTHVLIYLLRFVCIPEVLDSSPWYNSLSALMSERITICEWLTTVDPARRSDYAAEIAELRRGAAMRELTSKSGQSKVFVDTDRIVRELTPPFLDRVKRCLAYCHQLTDKLRQTLTLFGITPERIRHLPVRFVDASFEMFKSLFSELSHHFISSGEWGLDSNLSQRIRHGTLSGEMRALFERRNLITAQDAAGNYLENKYWIERLDPSDAAARDAISDAFTTLSAGVDELVSEMRNSWVQVKGEAAPKGYFDFEFDDDELHDIMFEAAQSDSQDVFIRRVFDALWARTEQNLDSLRRAVTVDLRERLDSLLDGLVDTLGETVPTARLYDVRNAVTTTKTQAQISLGRIADWFRVDHPEKMSAFGVSALLDAVAETINLYGGGNHIRITRAEGELGTMPGKYFRGLWDVFFILLENAARYSDESPALVTVGFSCDGHTMALRVANHLGPGVDREDLREKASRMSGHYDKFAGSMMTRREGGSGLIKLHKIVHFDMDCKDYELCCVLDGEGMFQVSLEAALEDPAL